MKNLPCVYIWNRTTTYSFMILFLKPENELRDVNMMTFFMLLYLKST